MVLIDLQSWDIFFHPGKALTITVPDLGPITGLVCVKGELVILAGRFAYRLTNSARWAHLTATKSKAIIAQANEGVLREDLVDLINLDASLVEHGNEQ